MVININFGSDNKKNTMGENVIELQGSTVILNGGNPLDGCPKNWDEAKLILDKLNEGKEDEDLHLKWDFDCGFKLDYDGQIVRISSRFYPPKTHYGSTWDGKVHVYFLGKEVDEKSFDCNTLEELKQQVDEYINGIITKVQGVFEIK